MWRPSLCLWDMLLLQKCFSENIFKIFIIGSFKKNSSNKKKWGNSGSKSGLTVLKEKVLFILFKSKCWHVIICVWCTYVGTYLLFYVRVEIEMIILLIYFVTDHIHCVPQYAIV